MVYGPGSRQRWPRLAAVVLGLGTFLGVGCGQGSTGTGGSPSITGVARGAGPYQIVTTCGMVTDLVRQAAGNRAQVLGLLGEGVDPHLYKPTRNDAKQLLAADLVFYSGLMLEGRMADTFTQVQRAGKPVFPVTEVLAAEDLREPPEFAGHTDPHVWMDVRLWRKCLDGVAEALAGFDPEHAAEYRENAARYGRELDDLDRYVERVIGSIPREQRVLVTAHDAFGYFSRRYGIEVQSVQGISTESEAGIADVNRLVDLLVARKVQAIFVESSVNPKHIEALIAGAASRGWTVRIGGELFSDAMGGEGTYEGTYFGMLDHNATTISRALGGEAPPRGLRGQLAPASETQESKTQDSDPREPAACR